MKTMNFKQAKASLYLLFFTGALLFSLMSCQNNLIYDDEGDCTVTYRIRFCYNMNLKWADAFANEVKSIRLCAFDENGVLVKEFRESGNRLAQPDYTMNIDLPAGNYHLVAWCGLDNEGAEKQHFEVPVVTSGMTPLETLTCRLNRDRDPDDTPYSDSHLEFMFHGELDVELPVNDDGGDYLYTMPLIKDTNHIRIILQHLSTKDVELDKFSFRIEDSNGYYAHNNELLDDETIVYRPYHRQSGEAGVGMLPSQAASRADDIEMTKTAIVDFSIGRMMLSHRYQMILFVTDNETEEVVAHIPIIDYSLLTKDNYEFAYGHTMTEQEFLDREDDYVLTFFLNDKDDWSAVQIFLHSWRIVERETGVGS